MRGEMKLEKWVCPYCGKTNQFPFKNAYSGLKIKRCCVFCKKESWVLIETKKLTNKVKVEKLYSKQESSDNYVIVSAFFGVLSIVTSAFLLFFSLDDPFSSNDKKDLASSLDVFPVFAVFTLLTFAAWILLKKIVCELRIFFFEDTWSYRFDNQCGFIASIIIILVSILVFLFLS